MIAIDLFSGAGGMSVGAHWAGIRVAVAIESDKYAAATYSHNHPDTHVICEDIRKVTHIDLPEQNEQLVLFGGPPCQGFSTSNQRTRSSANPSNWLFREYLRVVRMMRPDWVVFENVKGIMETEGATFLGYVLSGLANLDYTVSYSVLNAKDFGVPQNRSRLFVIGSLHGISVNMPEPVTSIPVTVREALADLPDLETGASLCVLPYKGRCESEYARKMRGELKKSTNHLVTRNAPHIIDRYRHIPQGGNWEDIPEHLMDNYADRSRCHTGIYRRLTETEPSVVIGNFRKNMLIHPRQHRGLSVREAARLQSFPDSFKFHGSIGFQQQQVGNAVPPLLAKAVFEEVMRCC